jgi:superfamily II DNA or RNA helicase
MAFQKARDIARRLGLRTPTEWKQYHKKNFAQKQLAESIPSNPESYYEEWVSYQDWLGESYAPYTSTNKPARFAFDHCRDFARSLKLNSSTEWRRWAKGGSRPSEVPANPETYYRDSGWISWSDWLSYDERGEWITYEAARSLVHSKKFRTYREFQSWTRQNDFPSNIPKDPRYQYLNKGWKNTSDWLGNQKPSKAEMWDFNKARDWVRAYSKKFGPLTHKEWIELCKEGKKPDQIYSNPKSYKEFISWEDWFGHETGDWLSFEDAREYVRALNLNTKKDWHAWTRSENYNPQVPKAPWAVYSGRYTSTNDWLGSSHKRFARKFKSFEEARRFARSLGFTHKEQWTQWAGSNLRPDDIPGTPTKQYFEEWISWGDWLGSFGTKWTKQALIGFLRSLSTLLPRLEPSELYAILRKNNCLAALESLGENSPLVMITKAALNGDQSLVSELSAELQSEIRSLPEVDDELQEIDAFDSDTQIDIEVEPEFQNTAEASLPQLSGREILDALDDVTKKLGISDEETIKFLIDKGIARIWQSVLSSTNPVDEVEKVKGFISDTYAQTIRNRFVDEFEAVQRLPIPQGYSFSKAGKLVQPNLMQRLIAHRLVSRKRVGNWSGTGAGKTLAAILGSRVVDSDLTLVIALNNTISDSNSGWALEIKNAFPASHVQIKDRGVLTLLHDTPNYLLLNYEAFQLSDSRAMVERLLSDHRIDLIVLDEIHSAKSRNTIESKRRQLLNYLITEAGKKNEDLIVLGMSATPVVNSLDEAASLLEMITSRDYSDLETQATIANALGMHQQLILNGVRYRPDYKMELYEETVEIRADNVTERILNLRKGDVLGLENILLESKLPVILDLAMPGTIVFSNFVEGIFDVVSNALQTKGLRVARFSGEDKSGLEEFKSGRADVLVGSAALGTGVDGLQYICNRLVILTLPWTSAGYEQLLGRIYRQGSRFDRIEVFIPQVVLNHEGQEWSWDKQRLGRIKYKKTLADAAVDGFVPEGKLVSRDKMFAEARKVLESWISALEGGQELKSTERSNLRVPLPPDTLANTLRRYGDFSQMNARIGASNSETTNTRFTQNSEEWYHYHSLYREARKSWPEVPYIRIAEGLAKRPDWVVADFGCGEGLLSKTIPNKVYNFDHIAIDETVTAGDMRKTNLDSDSVDVAVFSLSLMGVNWKDYLQEAHRVLRTSGVIEIAEPASKWTGEKLDTLKAALVNTGFELVGNERHLGQFLFLKGMKA